MALDYNEIVTELRKETDRWLSEPSSDKPHYSICLEDIRFAERFMMVLSRVHAIVKFVAPLTGKTVKINGLKFSESATDHGIGLFETELDYEEVK